MSERIQMMTRGRAWAAVSLFAVLGLVLSAPAAEATYDPLASGATRLSLDKSFLALLERNGVRLSTAAGSRLKAGTVKFPVSGGKFDPSDGKGTVEHEGTLLFLAGARRVPLRALLLRTTQRRAPFSVKVGGGQLKLAEAGKVQVSRHGFGSRVEVSSLKLSAKVATRLDKKLGLRDVFEPGQLLGAAVTTANPLTVAILGKNKVSLELDPAFLVKLQSLFVAVNPIFPAEHPGPFTLPIFGGTLAVDAAAGRVATEGALEFLQLGSGQVFWRDPTLDLDGAILAAEGEVEPSPPYAGKIGSVAIAAFARQAVSANAKARTITASGSLSLDPSMAAIFNEAFAKPMQRDAVFQAGEQIGKLSFLASGE